MNTFKLKKTKFRARNRAFYIFATRNGSRTSKTAFKNEKSQNSKNSFFGRFYT